MRPAGQRVLLELFSLSALTDTVTQALGNLALQPWNTSWPQPRSCCSSLSSETHPEFRHKFIHRRLLDRQTVLPTTHGTTGSATRDGHSYCRVLSPACEGHLSRRDSLLELEPESQINQGREGWKLSRSFSIRNKKFLPSKAKSHSH